MSEGNRLEAFTDAAFAFALTLLAISGDQMPGSVAELKLALHQIPSFLASAALLVMFWYQHRNWSRQYRTDDGIAVLLTAILVCTVLVYVYPLKMMFSGCFYWLSNGYLQASFEATGYRDIFDLIEIYGYGFITMCISMMLLYRHSLKQAERLRLNAEQQLRAKLESGQFAVMIVPAILSIILTYTLPDKLLFIAGMVYALFGVLMPLYGVYAEKKIARLYPQAAS